MDPKIEKEIEQLKIQMEETHQKIQELIKAK